MQFYEYKICQILEKQTNQNLTNMFRLQNKT
jgi:hypothetical protein